MAASDRIRYAPVEGADELFSPDFTRYLLALHDAYAPRVHALRAARAEMLDGALSGSRPLAPLPPSEATGDWQVPPVPEELRLPGIEISGPASVTPMFINALNPGPEGTRAEGDLDDDEDSAGHRLQDTLRAAINRRGAVERTLGYTDTARNREYRIREGDIPFFMHRERGLHLDEPDVQVDGAPISAALLGTALTLFYAGQAQAARGQGVYFYIPKTESPGEVAWYRDVFAASQEHLPGLRDAMIRGIILIESLPAVYAMEEMLHALGPYAAGLNAARWDLKASILEYVMADPAQVWPDRYGVDIKTTDFLANMFRRLVAVCHKHGAVAIGGMATALPSADEAVNARRRRHHPGGQGVGGAPGLPARLGGPHLPHEDGRRPLQGVARLGPDAGRGRAGRLPRRAAGAPGRRHDGGHPPQRAHGPRVPGGMAHRQGR